MADDHSGYWHLTLDPFATACCHNFGCMASGQCGAHDSQRAVGILVAVGSAPRRVQAGVLSTPIATRSAGPPVVRAQAAEELVEACSLRRIALAAASHVFAPFSHVAVGAAALTTAGDVFDGCNVENASYGLTISAERNPIFRAVSEKGRRIRIRAIAVATPGGDNSAPCGACRQVIWQFGPHATVLFVTDAVDDPEDSIGNLLPHAFNLTLPEDYCLRGDYVCGWNWDTRAAHQSQPLGLLPCIVPEPTTGGIVGGPQRDPHQKRGLVRGLSSCLVEAAPPLDILECPRPGC
jgi:cytidine deaminase